MVASPKSPAAPDLSVIVPSFNSVEWLPTTLDALARAVARVAGMRVEVLVVDDGSTDDTVAMLSEFSQTYSLDLRVISQQNGGRFLARWAGAQAARSESLLLLDSRVLIHEDALAYRAATTEFNSAWNANVVIDPEAPLVGLFWEVPTYLFWGSYLSRREATVISLENFDRVPKGTTCFLVPTAAFIAACLAAWPEGDPRFTSDDTRLLRQLAAGVKIRLDPGFSATYRPRTSLRRFLLHSYDRGTLFVDSYAGTSALRNAVLVGLALAPPVVLALLVILAVSRAWTAIVVIVVAAVLAIGAVAVAAFLRRCAGKAVAAFLVLVVPFGAVFWAGLARGLVVHRRSFSRQPLKETPRP